MSEQQTLIVTGASSGLGAAVARIAASKGLNVVLMARSTDALIAVANEIEAAGGAVLAVVGDVSQKADCQRVVQAAVDRFGGVDALVNNAGLIEPMARLQDVEVEAWERLMAVNVTGAMLMIQAALPYLRAAKGRVVNISSGAGARPRTGWGAYSVSKAALNMLTAMLAEEEPEVTVLAVRPGVIDTAMQTQIRDAGAANMLPEQHAHFVRLYESGDMMPPERPAQAIVALALYAPRSVDGEYLSWDDDVAQGLLRNHHGR